MTSTAGSTVVSRVAEWFDRHLVSLGLAALLFLLLVAALSPRIFVTIPAGHVGVLFKRFLGGTLIDRYHGEGMNTIYPWDEMYIYDVRYRQVTSTFDAESADGLPISIDVTFRYRLNRDNVPVLHDFVGPDYVQKLIIPDMGARVREEVSRHLPIEVYSMERRTIEEHILETMRTMLMHSPNPAAHMKEEMPFSVQQRILDAIRRLRYHPSNQATSMDQLEFIQLDEVLLKEVRLPESLREAIVRKDQQQQIMEEYDYRIEREKKEAERKRIEAQGIRDFQDLVKDGISDRYLMWKGVDATLQLAQSPNSKVIVIGSGDHGGLPVILGNLDKSPASPAQPAAPAPANDPAPDATQAKPKTPTGG